MPLCYLFFNRISDFRYQRGRHVRIVHFLELGDDFTGRHAFGVQGQNLAIHLRDARLIFLYQLRLEGVFTTARCAQIDLAIVAQQRFG